MKIVAGFLEPAFILGLSAPTPHPQYFSPHPHRTRRYFFTSSPHPHRTHNIFSAGYRDRTAVAVDRKPARCGLAHAGLCQVRYVVGEGGDGGVDGLEAVVVTELPVALLLKLSQNFR